MNRIRRIRRVASALAGLACAWLGFAVAPPAAFGSAQHPRPSWVTSPPRILPARALAWIRAHLPPGWNKHPPLPPVHAHQLVHAPVRTVVIGGMPGWQIALIAAGAALLAALVALLAYRAWAARRKPVTAPA
jgi:hypothetical protein